MSTEACAGCDERRPLQPMSNGKRYGGRCSDEIVAMGWLHRVEGVVQGQELSRIVFPRSQADYLLQQVLAAGMLLRAQEGSGDDGDERFRLAVAALDGVAREMRDRLSDSLTDRPDSLLVVDDEPEMVLATRRALEHSGFSVLTMSDGLSALNVLRTTPVAAVVLDLVMPGLSGWDVLREIRAATDLPVVVVTAYELSEADRLRGFEAGADDFVAKPYAPAELVARIRAVLRRETRTGGGARRRATSFEGRRVAVCARSEGEDLEEMILSRPMFHALNIAHVGSPTDVRRDLDRAPWDLVILDNPTATEVEDLNERLLASDSSTQSLLVIASPELLSYVRGPITNKFAFLATPYRAQELWAAVEVAFNA